MHNFLSSLSNYGDYENYLLYHVSAAMIDEGAQRLSMVVYVQIPDPPTFL
jgi:hypothetical protein